MSPAHPIRYREVAGVLLVYTAIGIWWLWPLPSVLTSHVPNLGGRNSLVMADLDLIIWALAWDSHVLVTAPWNLFHANSFYPSPTSLAYSEHFLGYVPFFAPTYWLSENPILATNVLILAIVALRGTALYLFARTYVSPPAAALGGLLYAFWPGARAEIMKFHVHGVFYLPLALYFTERWLAQARVRDACGIAVTLFLQAATSFYVAFAQAFAYGAYLVVALFESLRTLDRRRVAGLLLAAIAAAVPVVLLALPYLSLQAEGVVPKYGEGGVRAVGLEPGISLYQLSRYFRVEGVGPVGYALAAFAFLPPWRGRSRPLLIGLSMAVTGVVLAAGPDPLLWGATVWSPYELLMKWLPGFSSIRMPARFLIVTHLGLCLLVAVGAGALLARPSKSLVWVSAVAVAALALFLQRPQPLPVRPQPVGEGGPRVYRWLAENGAGRAVLELPRPGWPVAALRMLHSTTHWLPIVDGYSGYALETDDVLHDLAQDLPGEAALQEVVDHADIGWIVVHVGELPTALRERWRAPLPEGLEQRADFDGDIVFSVTRPPVNDRRALFLSDTRTLDGMSRQPLGASCPGAIRIQRMPAQPWPSGSAVPITVEFRNDGSQPWPAAGVIPDRLVRVCAQILDEGEHSCRRLERLGSDVPAGGVVVERLGVWTPRHRGTFTLEIGLVQVGEKSLEECGLAPLRVPVEVSKPKRTRRRANVSSPSPFEGAPPVSSDPS